MKKQAKKRGIFKEFAEFLNEYRIIALAVAFVMGGATRDLVKSLVDNIVMPLLNPLIPDGTWETATLTIGSVKLGWGAFVSACLYFVILAAVVFFLVKKLMRRKKTGGVPQVQY